jgi:autotransporter-associated beta strand protein
MFATGSAAPVRLVIDNATTFSGIVSGGTTGSINGLSLGGTGSLRITANASALTAPLTLTDSVRVSVVNDGVVSGGGVIGSSLVTVGGSATLGGNGSVGGLVVAAGGRLAPGMSPGTLSVTGSATFGAGGNYDWQLFDATGAAGTGWDLLSVGGVLDIAATSANPFGINLWTLSGTGPDANGAAANFNSAQNYSWTIASSTSGITGFSADKFVVRTSATNGTGGFANAFGGGTFSVAQSGNNLNLVFTTGPAAITITVASGTQTQTQAGYPTLSGSLPLVKAGAGTLVVDQNNTLTGSTTVQGGRLQLANGSALGSSRIVPLAGGTITLAAGGLQTTVGGLAANAGGLTDVGNGLVTVAAGLPAADMLTALLAGRGDGSWNGTSGITSSSAAADLALSIPRTVGWLDNGDGSVTFAYAGPGDTNLDWTVDILDAANFLSGGKFDSGTPATWNEGDFGYDGVVDILDAADFLSTGLFDAGPYNSAPGSVGEVAAVPEPSAAAAGLLAAAASLLLIRRRRSTV